MRAYTVESLGEAAFLLERVGLRGKLLVEQMAAEVEQGQRGIRGEFR